MNNFAALQVSCFFTLQAVFYSFSILHVEGSTYDIQSKLINYILDANRTSKRIRPVENTSKAVNVTMDMTLSNVIDIDEVLQILSVNMWVAQKWTNERMRWNPDDFGGIKAVTVAAFDVWLPDTILYNNVFEEFDGRLDNVATRVRVTHDGVTQWNAPFIFKTLCKIKVQNFPFDVQDCILKFGSWQYDASELDLFILKADGKLDETRVRNGEWDVLKIMLQRNVHIYPCCPNVLYPDITFVIKLKRRSLFYTVNLIVPNFLIALLAFYSFYIPVECGERISFVITVLLSMTVFLLLVAESIPPTSDAVPAIALYYTTSIVLVSLALVATGITLKISYSYMKLSGSGLSRRAKIFLFVKLGPCLGFDTHSVTEKLKQCDKQNKTDDTESKNFNPCCRELFTKVISRTSKSSENGDQSIGYRASRHGNHASEMAERNKHYYSSGTTNEEVSESFDLTTADSDIDLGRHGARDGISRDIRIIAAAIQAQKDDEIKIAECRLAAAIVDRAFMYLFVIVFVSSTLLILIIPYLKN